MKGYKRIDYFMPAKTPAKRTTRTRKSTTRKTASVAIPVASKTTYVRNSEGKMEKTVTEVVEKVTQTRPTQPNIKFDDYVADAKVRWQIHQYEVNELLNDCKWVYNNTKPIVLQVVDYCKTSYNRAFN